MDDTAEKSDALQDYLAKYSNKNQKLVGGIVDTRASGFFEFTGKKYNQDPSHNDWRRFAI